MSFVLRVLLNAVGFWLTSLILGSHFTVTGGSGTGSTLLVYLGVALLFALLNTFVKPIARMLSLPLYILTLGLFGLVLNALVLLAIHWLTHDFSWGLRVDGFWWAVLAGVVLAIINAILSAIVPGARRRA